MQNHRGVHDSDQIGDIAALLRNAVVEVTVTGPALLPLRRLWPQGTQATAMLPKGGREHGACSGAASTSGRADVWPRLGSAMQMTPAILRTILILILSLNLTPFLALFLIGTQSTKTGKCSILPSCNVSGPGF